MGSQASGAAWHGYWCQSHERVPNAADAGSCKFSTTGRAVPRTLPDDVPLSTFVAGTNADAAGTDATGTDAEDTNANAAYAAGTDATGTDAAGDDGGAGATD